MRTLLPVLAVIAIAASRNAAAETESLPNASENAVSLAMADWGKTTDDLGIEPCSAEFYGASGVGCGCCVSDCGEERGLSFKLTEFNIYPTFSYLDDLAASYNEFEFASKTYLGDWEMENRTVLNVADLPGTISLGPTNPSGDPSNVGVRAQGFGDVLSGFFFSRRHSGEGTHLGIGPVWTFPSATDDILGSGKYTVGPGAHFSTEVTERLDFGFFIWQSWTFAGDDSRKDVNQLFGKPFIIYELSEKWDLVYIPLGLSYSWNGPGNKGTVPLGGGIRRLCEVGGQKMGFQVQLFDYVARKKSDPEWELRMTIEFMLD
ncbi:hypothetical protein MalM25_15840 [Planctomycetes bacterium MalM25]|nr:hypothetical protein MalM25_15840 [Planctomycetes bacterium MalM25]